MFTVSSHSLTCMNRRCCYFGFGFTTVIQKVFCLENVKTTYITVPLREDELA